MSDVRAAMRLAAAASLAWALWSCGSGGDLGPKGSGVITLSEQSWDFGNVAIGTSVEHDFQISNTGSGPMRLAPQVDVSVVEGC